MTANKAKKRQNDGGQVHKNTVGDYVFYICNFLFFCLFTLICFFPFYFLFINTISDNLLVASGDIMFWPRGLHLENYLALTDLQSFIDAVWITVSRTVLGTFLMVIVSAFAGYIFTQRKMWRRKLWYRFIIIPMYFNAGLIPWFVNMLSLGLFDNYMAYIIPGLVIPFNIILVKTYIESIPADIEESARIDGAGVLTIFFRIMAPVCLPILATISIFGAVSHWNSFQDSLILMTNPRLFTLQHRLFMYLTRASDLQAQIGLHPNAQVLNTRVIQYTVAMVSIIPIVLVYPLLQRFFIKGIMLGAVKG